MAVADTSSVCVFAERPWRVAGPVGLRSLSVCLYVCADDEQLLYPVWITAKT